MCVLIFEKAKPDPVFVLLCGLNPNRHDGPDIKSCTG